LNIKLYQQYLNEYVHQAIAGSDGTVASIAENLYGIQLRRLFVSNRDERTRALQDAQHAFSEHRHWPLEIILRHLGVDTHPSD
jgi:hypothetical protein